MFNYNDITPDDLILFDFERTSKDLITAKNKGTSDSCGTINTASDPWEFSSDLVKDQYNLWVSRPERKIGQMVNIKGQTLDRLMSIYEELLIGAYLKNHPEETITAGSEPKFAAMIDWLRSTDFYRAPASTQYHDSVVGGLLVHSLRVYNEALMLHATYQFRSIPIDQVALVALVHDWCKIATYTAYQRNVKNEETGQWEKVNAFKHDLQGLTLGHGVTSLWYASKFFNLTEEEALAIRWHMGAWSVCDPEKSELQNANLKYPLVYLLQFADQLSCTDYRMV